MDKQAQAPEPSKSMLFSDEMVMNSPFFQDVIGLRFDDQGDGTGPAAPIDETESDTHQQTRVVPEALEKDILKPNPNDIIEVQQIRQRGQLALLALQLGNQEKLIRTLKIKLDRLHPAKQNQTRNESRPVELVATRALLRIPIFRSSNELEGWKKFASCAHTDPEVFFPEKGDSTKQAKKICSSCDVTRQCLEYALDNDEQFGIWGGLSEQERSKLRKVRTV